MKKERPPCEGGPPQQNIGSTLPLNVNGSGCYSSAVTASTPGLTGLNPNLNFSAGENGNHKANGVDLRTKDRIVFFIEAIKDLSLTGSQIRALAGGVFGLWQYHDEQMWAGSEAVARYWRYPLKTAKRAIEGLRKKKLWVLKKKGGGRGNSNKYALGGSFKTGTPKSPFELKGDIQGHKEGHRRPPHTYTKPKHTHGEDGLGAFTRDNWKTYCLELNPQRDPVDIDVTFDKAITEGARDNHWKHICRKFNSWYKPPTKPQAHAAARRHFTPTPRPAVRSSCESPRTAPLDYANRQVLETELQTAIKEGMSLEFIKASTPKALYDSVIASIYAKKGLGVAA